MGVLDCHVAQHGDATGNRLKHKPFEEPGFGYETGRKAALKNQALPSKITERPKQQA